MSLANNLKQSKMTARVKVKVLQQMIQMIAEGKLTARIDAEGETTLELTEAGKTEHQIMTSLTLLPEQKQQ
jgi:hypothetical protein